jgi:hypothetical protein
LKWILNSIRSRTFRRGFIFFVELKRSIFGGNARVVDNKSTSVNYPFPLPGEGVWVDEFVYRPFGSKKTSVR